MRKYEQAFREIEKAILKVGSEFSLTQAPEAINRGKKIPRMTLNKHGVKIGELMTDGTVFIFRSSVDSFKWKCYVLSSLTLEVPNYLRWCHQEAPCKNL